MKTYLARFSGLVVAGIVGFVTPVKGQAVSPGDLLVASSADNSILHFNASGTLIRELVPGRGKLAGPLDAVMDSNGDLLVATLIGSRVQRYNSQTGALLGTFIESLDIPDKMIFGSDGILYVSAYDAPASGIYRFDPDTGALLDVWPPGGFPSFKVGHLGFGPDGNLYMSDRSGDKVIRLNGTTGEILGDFVTTGSGGLDFPMSFSWGPDGNFYLVSARTLHGVLRYDGTTGAFIDVFVPHGSAGLRNPRGLSFGPDGNLYVTSFLIDHGGGAVYRYDGATGAYLDAFVPLGASELIEPQGLLFTGSGELIVWDYNGCRIRQFNDINGADLGDLVPEGGVGGLVQTDDLMIRPGGTVNTLSKMTGNVLRYDGRTGSPLGTLVPKFLIPIPDDFEQMPNGDILAISYGTDEILRFDGETGSLIGPFVTAGSGGLDGPEDLEFGPDGNLYVTNSLLSFNLGRVQRYNGSTGEFMDVFVPNGSGGMSLPKELEFGADGHLYVVERSNAQINRYHGSTGAFLDVFVAPGSPGLDNYDPDIKFGGDGNLYVVSENTNSVLRYNGQSGAFIDVFIGPSSGLHGPTTLAFYSAEHLVPAVSTWGLVVLLLSMLTLGSIVLRARIGLNGGVGPAA